MLRPLQRLARQKLRSRGLLPQTRLGRLAAYFAGLDLLLFALQRLSRAVSLAAGENLSAWITLITFVTGVLLLIVGVRWVRRRLMWRLRNRLIVTYTFIGVIPVVLLLLMGGISAYLLGGQFATYIASSDLQAELKSLSAINARIGTELSDQLRRRGKISQHVLRVATGREAAVYPNRETTVWYKGESVTSGVIKPAQPPPLQAPEVRAFVVEENRILLRSADTVDIDGEKMVVISSIPLDTGLLERVAKDLGEVTVSTLAAGNEHSSPAPQIRAGTLPPAANVFDREITAPGALPTMAWNSGEVENFGALLLVNTRPSMLKARLFRIVGESINLGLFILAVVAVVFGVVELLALLIGLRLSRTITRSVAQLYTATQRVEHADLSYRIEVTRDDQLAALERSFNSMMESLKKLIVEQREKQRLENELVIAQEVQRQLFPRELTELESLELHGFCRPARTVSGDYYDFLPLEGDRMLIAVGDVSGKGISAALLMATIHSAVRAYSLQNTPVATMAMVSAGNSERAVDYGGNAAYAGTLSPARLLAMLNRQLYRSTPAEKYATLFLGAYDGHTRTLSYSNAGHLPPLILATDGSLRKLTCGGTVVGLFDDLAFEEAEIELRPGDIFVAYSDGITEPENEFGEFGEERLVQLVRENRHLPLGRVADEITQAVSDWIGGGEQPDDLTLVLARPR